MIELYQFPISHFCEKVRWALDFKQLQYKQTNLLPGLHLRTTKKLTGGYFVPVLRDKGQVYQESSRIVHYLDEAYPEKLLIPADERLKKDAMEWQILLDEEIGVHIRRYIYYELMKYPDIVVSFFSSQGPWYGKAVMSFMFPVLRKKMIALMKINKQTAAKSLSHVLMAVDKINQRYEQHQFLVGEQFTVADMSAAALLAPVYMPDGYGVSYATPLPEPLQYHLQPIRDKTALVSRFL